MIQAPVGRNGGFTGMSRGCRDLSGFLPPQATLITVVSGKRALGCIVCTTVWLGKKDHAEPELPSFSSLVKKNFTHYGGAAPVDEWLSALTSVLSIIRSSHRCGFAPHSGRGSHVRQAKFCLRVCQVVFRGVSRFRSTYELIRLDMREK